MDLWIFPKMIFFRQATLLICRHLDIEISLAALLKYLQHFFPVRALFLNVFEQKMGAIRTMASATDAGGIRLNRLTYLDRRAREIMKSGEASLKKSQRLNIQEIPRLAEDALDTLMGYKWPGNVRELENIVERVLIILEGGRLAFDQLIDPVDDTSRKCGQTATLASLNQAVKIHLQQALEASGGKIYGPGGAAERIDINPNNFRSKMRKLGIRSNRRSKDNVRD